MASEMTQPDQTANLTTEQLQALLDEVKDLREQNAVEFEEFDKGIKRLDKLIQSAAASVR